MTASDAQHKYFKYNLFYFPVLEKTNTISVPSLYATHDIQITESLMNTDVF